MIKKMVVLRENKDRKEDKKRKLTLGERMKWEHKRDYTWSELEAYISKQEEFIKYDGKPALYVVSYYPVTKKWYGVFLRWPYEWRQEYIGKSETAEELKKMCEEHFIREFK